MITVVLDSTPVGLLCHPQQTPASILCRQWLADLQAVGRRVVLPEIIDFEIRREFEHRQALKAILQLESLASRVDFLTTDSPTYHDAAALWGRARRMGKPTAAPDALDIDMILVAQALSLGDPFVIATSNVRHISPFAPARDWTAITP